MVASPAARQTDLSQRGFSLVEMLVALGITVVILGATMAALGDAARTTAAATLITGLNDSLRNGMDLMVRDLLQGGQGLPSGHVIQIPSGVGAAAIRIPGPPGSAYVYSGTSFCPPPTSLCAQVTAIIPGPGRGPEVLAGQPTDMITVLAADGAFDQVRLTAFASDGSNVTIEGAANLLRPGDLLMFTKGSSSALAQVSSVSGQRVAFSADSLLLNQTAAAEGTIMALRNAAPSEVPSPVFLPTTVSRIRMISYYLDVTTDPDHPRLARRINNGDPVTFNNESGTVVAFDIDNLQITYDMMDGVINRSNVRMTAADLQGGGACGAAACSPNQIRKVNILLSARSRRAMSGTLQFFRSRLTTQVSLRSLAFVDRYQ